MKTGPSSSASPATYIANASGTRTTDTCNFTCSADWGSENGIFYHFSHTHIADITDGTSNTILVGETLPDYVHCTTQENIAGAVADHWYFGGDDIDDSNDYSEHLGSTGCPINSLLEVAYGSRHISGANFVLADGSVRFIRQSISPATFSALGSSRLGRGPRFGLVTTTSATEFPARGLPILNAISARSVRRVATITYHSTMTLNDGLSGMDLAMAAVAHPGRRAIRPGGSAAVANPSVSR